jgi:hypothetical protein
MKVMVVFVYVSGVVNISDVGTLIFTMKRLNGLIIHHKVVDTSVFII